MRGRNHTQVYPKVTHREAADLTSADLTSADLAATLAAPERQMMAWQGRGHSEEGRQVAANYAYGSGDPYSMDALMPPDLGELLATFNLPAKDQSRLPMPRLALAMPQQPAPRTGSTQPVIRPVSDKSGQAPRAMPQPAAAPLSRLGHALNPIDAAPPRPTGSGPRLNDYKAALVKAQEAGDEEAITHFESQIQIGLNSRKGSVDGNPVPQGGNILDAAVGGLPFSDELAGVGGGIASVLMKQFGINGLQDEGSLSANFARGYNNMTGDMRKRKSEFRERNPLTSMATEIGTGLATGNELGLLKKGWQAAMGTGALYGAGEGDGGIAERAKGAVTGGLTGGVVHAGGQALSKIGRVIFPAVAHKATLPGFREGLRTLEREGIPVTAAEQIGSKSGRLAERATGTYWNQANSVEARPQQLYSALMKRANFHPDDIAHGELTAEAVSRAGQRFSDDYERVLQGANVNLGNLDPAFARVEQEFTAMLPFEQKARISSIISDFRDAIGAKRKITGEDYKRLRSQMGKVAESFARNSQNNYLAPVLRGLRGALDDAFRAGAHPSRVAALRKIDQDYAGYKILQEAQKSAGGPDAIGTMANRMRGQGKRPRKEFRDLLTAYQDVILRGGAQTSGTAENSVAMHLIPPVMSMARAAGAKVSAGAARAGARNPLPAGSGSFIAGQQAPNSGAEDLVKALGELR